MANGYSAVDLLDFLAHASDKGLMPTATATALGVASRNVLGVLDGNEDQDLRQIDLDGVIRRFTNKRAKDFNPSSLKEYGRRVRKAVELFLNWKEDPANFTVKTRAPITARRKDSASRVDSSSEEVSRPLSSASAPNQDPNGYQSAFPIRTGVVVRISNLPGDLTPAEAERLAKFVRMLAVE